MPAMTAARICWMPIHCGMNVQRRSIAYGPFTSGLSTVQQRGLIRETEWSREYRVGPQSFSFESKILKDGMEISAAMVRDRWPVWSLLEQLDFVNAFILKPSLTAEDQSILAYLLEADSDVILDTVAHLLPRSTDRVHAFSFLIERLQSEKRCVGNYYQALEAMDEAIQDTRAVAALRQRYERYRQSLAPFDQQGFHSELNDYQHCCHALWKLDGAPEYEAALQELLTHPDPGIRRRSDFLLHGR